MSHVRFAKENATVETPNRAASNIDNTPPEGAETRITYCHLQLLGLSLSADGPDDPNGAESHQAHANPTQGGSTNERRPTTAIARTNKPGTNSKAKKTAHKRP